MSHPQPVPEYLPACVDSGNHHWMLRRERSLAVESVKCHDMGVQEVATGQFSGPLTTLLYSTHLLRTAICCSSL